VTRAGVSLASSANSACGANGPWQVRLASGQWKDFRNPYLQARDAALALRDAMGGHAYGWGALEHFLRRFLACRARDRPSRR
jgi:hypothetical protein